MAYSIIMLTYNHLLPFFVPASLMAFLRSDKQILSIGKIQNTLLTSLPSLMNLWTKEPCLETLTDQYALKSTFHICLVNILKFYDNIKQHCQISMYKNTSPFSGNFQKGLGLGCKILCVIGTNGPLLPRDQLGWLPYREGKAFLVRA